MSEDCVPAAKGAAPSVATMSTKSETATCTTQSSLVTKPSNATTTDAMMASQPPIRSITVQKVDPGRPPPQQDTLHRAIHKVSLSALSHNYGQVESAADRQRCSVIVVVKADGYGHGAIATALHLADDVGAGAFAVATLEEGIALRRAFQSTAASGSHVDGATTPPRSSQATAMQSFFQDPTVASQVMASQLPASIARRKNSKRPSDVRILVLGPPVGFPRCFDDYYHHGIEAMVSGPEVARSLVEWVVNTEERKRTQVERAANEMKAQALQGINSNETTTPKQSNSSGIGGAGTSTAGSNDSKASSEGSSDKPVQIRPPSATLGNVSGQDLAKEVRAILINSQKAAAEQLQAIEEKKKKEQQSRTEKDKCDTAPGNKEKEESNGRARKRLRWHALVDSGMGRLGFRTEPASVDGVNDAKDSVAIIKELVEMQDVSDCPIQFYGMCTHMADASSTSDYTNSQIAKFKSLLKRVRDVGITVPTVSTDNSAALLTPTLKHFDSDEILGKEGSATETRGFVRTGGAIYGQRPAFTQLRAVSTLMANVRHVAILKEGESVGYDRNYIAPYEVRIATLAIGFADGYPRELGNGVGKVEIRGHLFPIAGNVCMDMLMVELGPAEDEDGVGAQVVVGDTAVLWGPSEDYDNIDDDMDDNDHNDEDLGGGPASEGMVRLQDIASQLKTTQSACTCGLDKVRVLRQYG